VEPADTIARIGFRRWHERQLLECHAWLVTGILCVLAVVVCIGELRYHGLALQLVMALGIAAMAVVGLFGLTRYFSMLAVALRLGEHATCRSCGAYGRFEVISPSHVRCRACANEWQLID
jgi:hypothetical protein